MPKPLRYIGLIIGLGALMFGVVSIAEAGPPPLGAVVVDGSCPSASDGIFSLVYQISNVPGQITIVTYVENDSGAWATNDITLGVGGGVSTDSVVIGPAGTAVASLTGLTNLLSISQTVISGSASPTGRATLTLDQSGSSYQGTWEFDCTSGSLVVTEIANEAPQDRAKKAAFVPYTGIILLSDAEAAPYLSVDSDDYGAPCGVFDVNGWGRKYVGLGDFPACTPPDLTVMCLNGEGEWIADNVSSIVVREDGAELDFTSSQHGLCGIFEAED